MQERLDNSRHLKPNTPAGNLDLTRLVRYRIKTGIRSVIAKAYGLPENFYVQCFARVSPGKDAEKLKTTPEGHGADEKFITMKHDYTSLQKAPKWEDETTVINPHLDVNSILLIQIFAVDAVYKPLPDHSAPGTVTNQRG